MALHRDTAEADLHEPKGVSTASSGNVYTSNGLGSGSWGPVPGTLPDNTIVIEELSQFPTPVAGVITLASDTLYLIGAEIDLVANRLVLGDTTVIRGTNRTLSFLKSNTTAPFLTATGVDCRIEEITLDAPLCSKLVDFDGSSTQTLRLTDVQSTTHTNVAVECSNAAACILEFCFFSGGTDVLDLQGTGNTNLLLDVNGFFNFSGKGIDFGTSTWDDSIIDSTTFSGLSGSFSISGQTGSTNINTGHRCTTRNSTFNGLGTALQGILVSDILFDFNDNVNLEDSRNVAHTTLEGNGLTTSYSAGVSTKINATTWAESRAKRFSTTTDGRVTYIGQEPLTDISVLGGVTGSGASGSVEFDLHIAKNGTIVAETKARNTFPSTAETSVSMGGLVDVVNGDFLEIFVTQAGGVSFDAIDANMVVKD